MINNQIKKINFFHSIIFLFFSTSLALIFDQFKSLSISPIICLLLILSIGISHGALDNQKGKALIISDDEIWRERVLSVIQSKGMKGPAVSGSLFLTQSNSRQELQEAQMVWVDIRGQARYSIKLVEQLLNHVDSAYVRAHSGESAQTDNGARFICFVQVRLPDTTDLIAAIIREGKEQAKKLRGGI